MECFLRRVRVAMISSSGRHHKPMKITLPALLSVISRRSLEAFRLSHCRNEIKNLLSVHIRSQLDRRKFIALNLFRLSTTKSVQRSRLLSPRDLSAHRVV